MPVGIGWIIRARGLAPSVGAGGTIVAAGVCALAFMSAMLAFRAWPEGDGSRADGSLSLRVPELKASGRAASPRPGSALAAPAAPARTGRASRGDRATRPRVRAVAPRGAYRAPVASPAPVVTAPRPATPTSAAPRPAAPSGGAAKPSPPASPAPGPVESTVATGREIVQQVAAPPPAARRPVEHVLDTAQDTARTVDGIVKPLLP